MKNLVSIIITTYNRSELILDTIHSCLQQTYVNIEIIVIDDGSTDDTANVLADLIENKQINYFFKINEERAAARNYGIKNASGWYIKFLDSDDLIETDYIETCIKYFETNVNYELLHTNCKVLNENGSISILPSPKNRGNMFERLWDQNDIALSSVIMKRSVFEKHGGFDETRSLSGAEDWEYWVRLSKQGCVFGFVPAYVTLIRRHKDNSTMNDIDKIIFSGMEGQRLLELKFSISKSLTRNFAARLIYLKAVYYYIHGKRGDSFLYLFKAVSKNWLMFYKTDFWGLLLKIFLPKKLIYFIKQKRAK